MPLLQGVIPVIPTPFLDKTQRIDLDSFEKIIEYSIQEGANALCLFAGGAEFYKTDKEERRKMMLAAVTVNRGRLPLLVTVSEHGTVLAAWEAQWYQEQGASALNIMPPSFGGPSGSMVAGHLETVCGSVSIPVMIQYAPALTGMSLAFSVFESIAEKNPERELYAKIEASPTGPFLTAFHKQTKGKYHIVVGNGGECMFEALKRGACAVMPGTAMIHFYREIYDTFHNGNMREAFEKYNRFLPFLHFMKRDMEQFVAMEKWILYRNGVLPNAVCREPNNYPDEQSLAILAEILKLYH